MSTSRVNAEAVAERWIERVLAAYPAEAASHLGSRQDPFRNPAGHTIRESLTTLARELLDGMDEAAVAGALDGIVRLRAVQGLRPSEALGFVFKLREAVVEAASQVPPDFEGRIDALALMAFDQYMACREQIAGLREKELRMRMQYATR